MCNEETDLNLINTSHATLSPTLTERAHTHTTISSECKCFIAANNMNYMLMCVHVRVCVCV